MFNLTGEKVVELFEGKMEKGIYEHHLNGEHLSGGVYICVLKIKEKNYTEKLMLLK